MKNIKILALVLSILLSVSMIGTGFAEASETSEPVAEIQVTVAAPVVEPTMAPQTEKPAQQPTAVPADEQPEMTAEPVQTGTPVNTEAAPEAEATPEATEEATAAPTDEATAEPTEETTPEVTEEPTETPMATEIPVNRSVIIHMDVPANLQYGDTITLSAELIGYDDVQVALQWQYTTDGEHWTDATGAGSDSLTYFFQVDDQTAGTSWRLAVTIL